MNIPQELDLAKAALRQRDRYKARSILRKVLDQEPRNLDAWLLFANAAQKPEHAVQCLERVLKLDPGNPAASLRLDRLRPAPPAPEEDEPLTIDEFQPGDVAARLQFGSQPAPAAFGFEGDTPAAPVAVSAPPASVAPQIPSRAAALPAAPPVRAAKPKGSVSNLEKLLLALIGLLSLCLLCGLGFTLLRGLTLTGSAASRPSPTPENYAATLYENIRASNAEDMVAYMATIHPRSPAYGTTEEMLKTIFDSYDLSYTVSGVSVLEVTSQEVRLSFTLVTRKIRGPNFRNNQVTGVMILRKDGDAWKIYDQKIDNIQYLD